MPTPEELARQQIDALLQQCGWLIQDYKKLDLSAGCGIAIREVRLKEGRCDYLLLIDRKPVGIIEAKKAGVTLLTVLLSNRGTTPRICPALFAANPTGALPFLYESTGVETYLPRRARPPSSLTSRLHLPPSGDARRLAGRTGHPSCPTCRRCLSCTRFSGAKRCEPVRVEADHRASKNLSRRPLPAR